jgi:peptide deformylase
MKKFLYALLALAFAISCNNNNKTTFSNEELEIINKYPQKIMRVLQTDNREDSLFLRQKTKEFTNKDLQSSEFKMLQEQMLLTVNDTTNPGVGIAAPQVGILRRLVAVQRFDKADEPFEFYANPYIIDYSTDTQVGVEGCLSVPNRRSDVERSQTIIIKYIDSKSLEACSDTVSGYTAVIFQHEIDHLDGILYIDKLFVNEE